MDAKPANHGTPKVGYMPPVPGGFRCANCKHFQVKKDGTGCDQKEVIAELGAGKNGLAPVDDDGCCDEFEPRPPEGIAAKFHRLAETG